jgi:hypothetical protein
LRPRRQRLLERQPKYSYRLRLSVGLELCQRTREADLASELAQASVSQRCRNKLQPCTDRLGEPVPLARCAFSRSSGGTSTVILRTVSTTILVPYSGPALNMVSRRHPRCVPGEGILVGNGPTPTHKKPSDHSGVSIPLVLSLDGLHHIAGRSAVGTSGWHSFSRERRSGRERPPKPPNRFRISSLRTRDHPDCDACSEPLGSLRHSQGSAATAIFAYSRYLKILSERDLSHCERLFYRT